MKSGRDHHDVRHIRSSCGGESKDKGDLNSELLSLVRPYEIYAANQYTGRPVPVYRSNPSDEVV